MIVVAFVAIWIAGNIVSSRVRSGHVVPAWAQAPTTEKLMRLAWPTAIIVYRRYPVQKRPLRQRTFT